MVDFLDNIVTPAPVSWALTLRFGEPYNKRYWSGDYDLDYENYTWGRGDFITFSFADLTLGAPKRRMSLTMVLKEETESSLFLEDRGPAVVETQPIASDNDGMSWHRRGRSFLGRISGANLTGRNYAIEVETIRGDADRKRSVTWSHSHQALRGDPLWGPDTCFDMVSSLESGIEHRWPRGKPLER